MGLPSGCAQELSGSFGSDATLGGVFICAETKWHARAGFAMGDRALSFGTLCSMARAVLRLLLHYGVKPGDRIAVLSKYPLECLTTFWGVTLIGAIFVPLNPSSGHDTLRYILNQSVPMLLFYNSSEQILLDSLCTSVNETKCIVAAELLREYSSDQNYLERTAPPSPYTPAVILYTSGLTGHPKGVVLSHRALCKSGEAMASHYQWSSADRFLNLAEFHTMSGLRNSAIVPFIAGTLVLQAKSDERESFFKIIESIKNHRATLLGCAPIFVKQLSLFMDRVDPRT